jgi:hypothetical protein
MRVKIAFSIALLALLPCSAGAASIHIPVSCEVAGKVDAGLDVQVCTEMIGVLKQNYPAFKFVIGAAGGPPSLSVIIHNATKTSVALHLKWRTVTGQVTEGQPMSITIMDSNLNAARRNSLYQRAVAATPMPKPD